MAKVNPVVTENIHRNLVEYARENYPRFYYLSYSYVKNEEAAMDDSFLKSVNDFRIGAGFLQFVAEYA